MTRGVARQAVGLIFVLVAACAPTAVQQPSPPAQPLPSPIGSVPPPPGGSPAPQANQPAPLPNQPQPPPPRLSGSQRTEYVWQKMMEGVAMGGAVGGPFGAGGGLIVGLITGLLTADAHYADLQVKIQGEKAKDRELEAQIDREIERQRELEEQVAKDPQQPEPKTEPQRAPRQDPENRAKKNPPPRPVQEKPTQLASLDKKKDTPAPLGSPFKNVEVKDLNGDGIPDSWTYHNPRKPGEIIRQEEASKGDGRVDVWSYFQDGKLVRREVDTKGSGTPDTFYYYENDQLAREERHEKGDGRVSYRRFYQNGRLTRVERSTRADGKINLWTQYDPAKDAEVVLKEEWDLNGDGGVDVWSYYENGRLVRRDVSATGLEYLSRNEKIPTGASPESVEPPPSGPSPTQASALSPEAISRPGRLWESPE